MLYPTCGVLAGFGIGLGYIVPIATLVKWFPDRRGFITGVAVAGFGGGAVLTTLIARALVTRMDLFQGFAILGIIYLVMVVGAGFLMKNPPQGWQPEGFEPETDESGERSGVDYELGGALKTWQWFALWAILFLNVTVGIALISKASPLAQEISAVDATVGATLVILISVGNAAGRFLWAWLSDAIGRKGVFITMFLLQAVLFFLIPVIGASYALLAILAIVIASCYGGGFGTMPAFNADYFGSANVGKIYGLMLTAWSFGGVLGPLLISRVVDATGAYANAMYILAGLMVVSTIVPLIVRPPEAPQRAEAGASSGAEARA